MLTYALDEEMLKPQYDGPVLAPLFQFPPTWASTHPKSLKD